MVTRKSAISNENNTTPPRFRSELYDQSRLKSLADNLKKLDGLFHSRTTDGQHIHKELSPNEEKIAQQLKSQIRSQLAELMSEGIPKQKLQQLVMECCAPTIEFLSKD